MPTQHPRFLKGLLLFVSLPLPWLAWSCAIDDPCDPGQELDRNYCVDIPTGDGDGDGDGPSSGGSNAGGETAGGGEGGKATLPETEPEVGEFGRVCSNDADCAEPAPYCAISPFSEDGKGVCSAQGCDSAGLECPEGWSCLAFVDTCTED